MKITWRMVRGAGAALFAFVLVQVNAYAPQEFWDAYPRLRLGILVLLLLLALLAIGLMLSAAVMAFGGLGYRKERWLRELMALRSEGTELRNRTATLQLADLAGWIATCDSWWDRTVNKVAEQDAVMGGFIQRINTYTAQPILPDHVYLSPQHRHYETMITEVLRRLEVVAIAHRTGDSTLLSALHNQQQGFVADPGQDHIRPNVTIREAHIFARKPPRA